MATTTEVSPPPSIPSGGRYDPDAYDICRPGTPPPEHETDSERLDRLQREFEALRDCVNAELKVRTETSLLSFIIVKIVLPFAAIAAGFAAIYNNILRTGQAESNHAELLLGIGYAILAAGAILLWRAFRQPGAGGRGDHLDRSLRSALRITVPPSKAQLTRNTYVNRWILFWLTWGLIIGLPVIFFIFRSDVLDRAGLHLTLDTANVCAPTVEGFNPYEGSDVCDNRGYTYTDSRDVTTSAAAGLGTDAGVDTLDVIPPKSVAEANAANVRLDVTTTLVLYFLILIAGIVVNMIRWWREDKRRKGTPGQAASARAATGPP